MVYVKFVIYQPPAPPFTPSLRYSPHLFLSNSAPLSCIGKRHLTVQNLHITRLTLQYDLVYCSISIRLYTSYLKSSTEIRIVKRWCARNNTGARVRSIGYEQYYLFAREKLIHSRGTSYVVENPQVEKESNLPFLEIQSVLRNGMRLEVPGSLGVKITFFITINVIEIQKPLSPPSQGPSFLPLSPYRYLIHSLAAHSPFYKIPTIYPISIIFEILAIIAIDSIALIQNNPSLVSPLPFRGPSPPLTSYLLVPRQIEWCPLMPAPTLSLKSSILAIVSDSQ